MSIESIFAGHFDIVLLITLVTTFWILPGGRKQPDDPSALEEGLWPDQG